MSAEGTRYDTPHEHDNILSQGDETDESFDGQGDIEEEFTPWPEWERQAFALYKTLWPGANHERTIIDFLAQGGYNKVVNIVIFDEHDTRKEYVLRLPFDEGSILSSVGLLRHLRRKTALKVPEVIFYDNTSHNALGHGFIILKRIQGTTIRSAWPEMTHGQRMTFAEELGSFYDQLRKIGSPTAGEWKVPLEETARDVERPEALLVVEPYGAYTGELETEIDYDDVGNSIIACDRLKEDPPHLSLNDMMLVPFRRRIYQYTHFDPPETQKPVHHVACLDIIQEMVDLHIFDEEEQEEPRYCLWHPDRWPRNMMVDINASPMITGILDWDESVFAPSFVSATPPFWMWQSNSAAGTNMDSDFLHLDVEMEPLSLWGIAADAPENDDIKYAFEQAAGEAWCRQAYRPELACARRLLRLVQHPRWNDICMTAFYEVAEVWMKCKTQTPTRFAAGPEEDDKSEVLSGLLDSSHDGSVISAEDGVCDIDIATVDGKGPASDPNGEDCRPNISNLSKATSILQNMGTRPSSVESARFKCLGSLLAPITMILNCPIGWIVVAVIVLITMIAARSREQVSPHVPTYEDFLIMPILLRSSSSEYFEGFVGIIASSDYRDGEIDS
ncbi:phosphotransferase enzyme family-domain-containing protein [Xylariaceae sp. FL0016]|nr:phosphotransferase enzyme family-domain-containing protein [Xylariaceae sp. FL0016]